MRRLTLLLTILLLCFTPALAQLTDSLVKVAEIPAPMPGYLQFTVLPQFTSGLYRIGGDLGEPIPGIPGDTWGYYSRHHYSLDQPWNSDETLLIIKNGDSPTSNGGDMLLLDGFTYEPLKNLRTECGYSPDDDRWMPWFSNSHQRVALDGQTVFVYDVVTCTVLRSYDLTGIFDTSGFASIGGGNGSPTQELLLALNNGTEVIVLNLHPWAAPVWHGPVYSLLGCGLAADPNDPGPCTLGSSSGGAQMVSDGSLLVRYKGDANRMFDVDPVTLEITPRTSLPPTSCSGIPAGMGYIESLAHVDVGSEADWVTPVAVGVRRSYCSAQVPMGYVVKVNLLTGAVAQVTWRGPVENREQQAHHVSMRAVYRPGYALVTYRNELAEEGTRRYSDEVVWMSLAGPDPVTHAVEMERLAHTHTDTGPYTGEGHGVPSPTGGRALFSSNWAGVCVEGCGSADSPKAYVVIPSARQEQW